MSSRLSHRIRSRRKPCSQAIVRWAPGRTPASSTPAAAQQEPQKGSRPLEHAFACMKTWKILRDCPLRGDGVRHAMHGVARLHNLALKMTPAACGT
jgi:hypothetical protein